MQQRAERVRNASLRLTESNYRSKLSEVGKSVKNFRIPQKILVSDGKPISFDVMVIMGKNENDEKDENTLRHC